MRSLSLRARTIGLQDDLVSICGQASRLLCIPMLLAVSLCSSETMNVLPGGPEALYAGENLDPAAIAYVRRNLGLDQPLPVQYVRWIAAAARGDLGRSFRDGQPVLDHIAERLPAMLQLSMLALLLALAVAIPAGRPRGQSPAFLARPHPRRRRASWDFLPSFWLGIMLILLFSGVLGWLPGSGMVTYGRETDVLSRLQHAVLPTVTWHRCRSRRSCATRARRAGGAHRGLCPHGPGQGSGAGMGASEARAPQRADSVVTLVGLSLPTLVGGSVIVETVSPGPDSAAWRSTPSSSGTTPYHGNPDDHRDGDRPGQPGRPISCMRSSIRESPMSSRDGAASSAGSDALARFVRHRAAGRRGRADRAPRVCGRPRADAHDPESRDSGPREPAAAADPRSLAGHGRARP